ncbi:MAG: leucyl aminopeptidase family protein, partial [Steroidobacteraceae bacterium]
ILADALAAADAEQPELLLDFATLTGAARVALGPELPAVFTDDESLRQQIMVCAQSEHDPVWPLPMWDGYDDELSSRIADLNNVASHSFAGSVLAALY